MVATVKQPASKPTTARQDVFARLIVSGKTQSEAWKEAYGHPKAKEKTAMESGCRIAAMPAVAARIQELRAMSGHKAVLSLNDRLAIMAEGAQTKTATWGERARCVEVYNKTAGDYRPGPPEEVIHKGDAANPVSVTVRTATKAEKIAALTAARAAGKSPVG